jgi:pyruvyltransferase
VLSRVPQFRRENNFGDLLGPWIVARIRDRLGLRRAVSQRHRLLTVGSIINLVAREDDIVWGSGIHGNFLPLPTPFPSLDIRAVRGPLTAELLRESGNKVPDVYGDPALLVPYLWRDSQLGIERCSGGTVIVPNYYDLSAAPPGALNPRGSLLERIRLIASANRVIASSLHGIVIAEAYGVPAVLVASESERRFKYEDYYGGTGRSLPPVASDWQSALGAPAAGPIKDWDPRALLSSFPTDLWGD